MYAARTKHTNNSRGVAAAKEKENTRVLDHFPVLGMESKRE